MSFWMPFLSFWVPSKNLGDTFHVDYRTSDPSLRLRLHSGWQDTISLLHTPFLHWHVRSQSPFCGVYLTSPAHISSPQPTSAQAASIIRLLWHFYCAHVGLRMSDWGNATKELSMIYCCFLLNLKMLRKTDWTVPIKIGGQSSLVRCNVLVTSSLQERVKTGPWEVKRITVSRLWS